MRKELRVDSREFGVWSLEFGVWSLENKKNNLSYGSTCT